MAAFTICIPSYNAESIVGETIESILSQTFSDWECLIVDDGSTDDTEKVVRGFGDPRIRFVKHENNVGYAANLQRCVALATGRYIYLLGNDDILSPFALERTFNAFQMSDDIGLVTRPYYWFKSDDPDVPVRHVAPLDGSKDTVVSIRDDSNVFRAILHTLGQLSSLAFKRECFVTPLSPYIFTAHIQSFLGTFKAYDAVFLKDYVVAIRIDSSQTRTLSSIYDPSPLWSWITMMDSLFAGDEWVRQRKTGRDHIAKHVEGLVQIRCASSLNIFLREAWLYLKYRPLNLLSAKYWSLVIGCLVIPPTKLRRLIDTVMRRISTRELKIQTINSQTRPAL